MLMYKGGISGANEHRCFNHINRAIFCIIFWNWIYPKYAPKNVMGYGDSVPYCGNFNSR